MAGQPGPRRPGPVRLALASGRLVRAVRRSAAADLRAGPVDGAGMTIRSGSATAASRSSTSTPRIGREPDLLVGGRRPDDAVQALVIGHAEPGQAELDGPLRQLVGRRGAVEEGEVRVAVELGIGGHRDG